jgi:hypothetical protein
MAGNNVFISLTALPDGLLSEEKLIRTTHSPLKMGRA